MAFKKMVIQANSTPASGSFTVDGSVIIGLQVANISTTGPVKVDITLAGTYIIRGVSIPLGSSLSVMDGKIIANNTEKLQVSTDGETVDTIVSYLEV